MSFQARLRLVVFELVILSVVVALAWAAYRIITVSFTQEAKNAHRAEQLFMDLTEFEKRSRTIANQLENQLTVIHQTLLEYTLTPDAHVWERFQQQSRQLTDWLENQKPLPQAKTLVVFKPLVINLDVRMLMEKVDSDLADYLTSAQSLPAALQSGASDERRRRAVDQVTDRFTSLLVTVGQVRGAAHTTDFIFLSPPRFPWSTLWIVTPLLLVVVCCGWVAVLVYRREMTAMRRQLTDSQTLLERQTKLADKGRVAAERAHEIRNPLTAITIRLHTLQRALLEGSSEHRDATIIRKEIRRLNTILDNFLQLDQGPELHVTSVPVKPLLEDVRDLLEPESRHNQIRLTVDAPADLRCEADTQQIKQVLINLVKNAIECVPIQGQVALRARADHGLHRGQTTDVAVIEVEDNGPGIADDLKDRLFEPFFSTKRGGTGLGLSIASQIVERHGGTLNFDENANHGTTFRVILPLREEN